MPGKIICTIAFLLLVDMSLYSQYHISGYLNSEENNKLIYISLLRYNEENAIYEEQVLFSLLADSSGYFETSGKLLPDVNKLYRIHSNTRESEPLLEFVESGENKNHHHFIFSNRDTIFFPQGENIWFNNSINTNNEDREWRMATNYEIELLKEYSKSTNSDAISEANKKFLNEYKSFASDSLSGSLARLMVFAHLNRKIDVSQDYMSNPGFYNNLLDDLKKDYSGTSYYSQFQADLINLSASITERKLVFYKRINYLLSFTLLISILIVLFLLRKISINRRLNTCSELSALTLQEARVAELICTGMSNKEIAKKLFVSLSTIKSHISNINRKLRVTNRIQLEEKLKNHTWD